MAITYLNNIPKQNTTTLNYVGDKRIKLGQFGVTKYGTPKGEVMGVNVKFGAIPQPQKGFLSDRAPYIASGLNINRTPNYGSGKVNRNTVFNPDFSTGPNAKYQYFSPLKPTSKKFNSLST
jgi:hypothetical protein